MKIGINIKKLREEKKMTQKDLAEKLFLSPQAISRYEKDEVEPSLDIIENMAEIFGCSTDEIIHGTKSIKSSEENIDVIAINANKQDEVNNPEEVIKCHDCGKIIKSSETKYDVNRHKDGASIKLLFVKLVILKAKI